MMVRKSRIIASRAVDSQQTLVTVPAISSVSTPRPRSSGSSSDEPGAIAL